MSLQVYDVEGRRIEMLVNRFQRGGDHAVAWDRRVAGEDAGQVGVRFVQIRFGGEMRAEKVLVVR